MLGDRSRKFSLADRAGHQKRISRADHPAGDLSPLLNLQCDPLVSSALPVVIIESTIWITWMISVLDTIKLCTSEDCARMRS